MKDRELLENISKSQIEMKEFLVGTEFDKKNCLSYRFDSMENKQCIMQNQLSTLMADREKDKNKISIKVPKWLTTILGVYVKTNTGV